MALKFIARTDHALMNVIFKEDKRDDMRRSIKSTALLGRFQS